MNERERDEVEILVLAQRIDAHEEEHRNFREEVRGMLGSIINRLDVKINGRLDEHAKLITTQALAFEQLKGTVASHAKDVDALGEKLRGIQADSVTLEDLQRPLLALLDKTSATPPQLPPAPAPADPDQKPITRRDLAVALGAILLIQMLFGFVLFVQKFGQEVGK